VRCDHLSCRPLLLPLVFFYELAQVVDKVISMVPIKQVSPLNDVPPGSRMKKALVALPDQAWDIIDHELNGKMGTENQEESQGLRESSSRWK